MKIKTFLLLPAVTALYFFLCSPFEVNAAENLVAKAYVQSGKELFEAKDYDSAIVEFNKALLADPDYEEALIYMRLLGFGGKEREERILRREKSQSANKNADNKEVGIKENKTISSKSTSVKKSKAKTQALPREEKGSELNVEQIQAQSTDEEKAALQALHAKAALDETMAIKELHASKNTKQVSKKQNVQKSSSENLSSVVTPVKRNQSSPDAKVARSANNSSEKSTQDMQSAVFEDTVSPVAENQEDYKKAKSPSVKAKSKSSKASSKKPTLESTKEKILLAQLQENVEQEQDFINQKLTAQMDQEIQQVHTTYKAKRLSPKAKVVMRDIDGDGISEKISSAENKAIDKIKVQFEKDKKVAFKKVDQKAIVKKEKIVKQLQNKEKIKANDTQDKPRTKTSHRAGDIVSQAEVNINDIPSTYEINNSVKEESYSFNDTKEDPTVVKESSVVKNNIKPKSIANKKVKKVQTQKPAAKTAKARIVEPKQTAQKTEEFVSSSLRAGDVMDSDDVEEMAVPSLYQQNDEKINDAEFNAGLNKTPLLKNNTEKSSVGVNQTAVNLNQEEVEIKAKINQDLVEDEKNLRREFAQEKAAKINNAKRTFPTVGEKVEGNEIVAQEQPALSSGTQSQHIDEMVDAKNEMLKEKLAAVLEMSQKDQKIIQELEKNTTEQTRKIEILENNLLEAKQMPLSAQAELKEKEKKLVELKEQVLAIESDMKSKEFNFNNKQLEYEKKLQVIEMEFGNYKTQKAKTQEDLNDQLRILKEALSKKIAELKDVQDKLLFAENKLEKTQKANESLTKQYDEIKKTLSDLEGRLGALRSDLQTDQALVVPVDPASLPAPKNQQEVVYQQWILRHDKLVTKLKEKLLQAKEQMNYLGRYDIKLSDQKMAALKEQLAAVKKQLNGQEGSANQKFDDYAAKEQRLKDVQERLEMVEKILGEKDEQIQDLEKQLNGVLSSF